MEFPNSGGIRGGIKSIGHILLYMVLEQLATRLLALYKYALSWKTRDILYMTRAYTGGSTQ